MAFLSTQPYKGTRDFYPDDMQIRNWIFSRMREVCESFGYREYDAPMLEPFELYAAKSGEELVNQQLYWMMDRGDRKMAVRPEMTPSMARMVAGKIQELPKPVRWYSVPNLWRYERPQRGRLREHWQLNVDVLGADPLYADAELLNLAFSLIRKFGGERFVSIRVNNRRLMDEFFSKNLQLDADTTLKVVKLVDARAKLGEEKYAALLHELGIPAPQVAKLEKFFTSTLEELAAEMPSAGVDEVLKLFSLMNEAGVATSGDSKNTEAKVVFDPMIMRGLDYYTGTVFEMFDTSPENNRAMFGGGRYDNLVGMFGKDKLSGVGFGMGDVTLRDFLDTHGLLPKMRPSVDVFVSLPKEDLKGTAERIARELRDADLRTITPLEVGGFGAQLKLALKHGARFAVLFGDAEYADGKVLVKDLEKNIQESIAFQNVAAHIAGILSV